MEKPGMARAFQEEPVPFNLESLYDFSLKRGIMIMKIGHPP